MRRWKGLGLTALCQTDAIYLNCMLSILPKECFPGTAILKCHEQHPPSPQHPCRPAPMPCAAVRLAVLQQGPTSHKCCIIRQLQPLRLKCTRRECSPQWAGRGSPGTQGFRGWIGMELSLEKIPWNGQKFGRNEDLRK